MTAPWRWRIAGAAARRRWQRELVSELLRPVEVGEPLPDALADAAKEHESPVVAATLDRLARSLAGGAALSAAVADAAPVADDALRVVALAGERSGRLAPPLQALERVLDEQAVALSRARDAWIEPGLTLVVALVVALGLLSGPLLDLVGLADPRGEGVLARALAALAAAPVATAAVAVALAALVVLAVRAALASDDFGTRVPLLGPVRREAERALAVRCLAVLVQADVPVADALGIATGLMPAGGRARRALDRAAWRTGAGESPTESVPDGDALGPLLAAVLAGGGRDAVAAGLGRLADFHEWELARRAEIAAGASELVAVGVAGLVAGAVVIGAWGTYFESLGRFWY